jgi:hypothetical protein
MAGKIARQKLALKVFFIFLCICFLSELAVSANASSQLASTSIKNYYNSKNQLEFTVLPDGKVYRSLYDANGNLSATRLVSKSVELPDKVDLSAPSYDIYIYGVNEKAESVTFPTWTDSQWQDDLEWIPGEKVAPGIWKARVVFKKHNLETGLYLTHIYVDGSWFGDTRVQVYPSRVQLNIPAEVGLHKGSYEIQISNVSDQVTSVNFPTWTDKDGQDDVIWIPGERVNQITWKATIPFANYNYLPGRYISHIYGYDAAGNSLLIQDGSTVAKIAVTSLGSPDLTNPSFDVYAYGIDAKASQVTFPTWTLNNGQDDVKWHSGQKIADGVWKATVRLDEHQSEQGTYATHVYVDDKFFGDGYTNVAANHSVIKAPTGVSLSSRSYDITIDGMNSEVTSVLFPTWTRKDGQDDLEWIQGVRTGENSWKAQVEFAKHNNEVGDYITHIYGVDRYGNQIIVNSLSVVVK